jgi:hypothetical protein
MSTLLLACEVMREEILRIPADGIARPSGAPSRRNR